MIGVVVTGNWVPKVARAPCFPGACHPAGSHEGRQGLWASDGATIERGKITNSEKPIDKASIREDGVLEQGRGGAE